MDVAHNNFQPAARNPGAYQPLAELLQGDGYRDRQSRDSLAAETLRIRDLSAAAAYGANDRYWTYPPVSAFTRAEIMSLYRWLSDRGSLQQRLHHLKDFGPPSYAFTFRTPSPSPNGKPGDDGAVDAAIADFVV